VHREHVSSAFRFVCITFVYVRIAFAVPINIFLRTRIRFSSLGVFNPTAGKVFSRYRDVAPSMRPGVNSYPSANGHLGTIKGVMKHSFKTLWNAWQWGCGRTVSTPIWNRRSNTVCPIVFLIRSEFHRPYARYESAMFRVHTRASISFPNDFLHKTSLFPDNSVAKK